MTTLPTDAKTAARKDKRIVEINVYPDGWVPNSYRWRSPGVRHVYRRNGSGHWKHVATIDIDRKRPHGDGPSWIGKSATGGRLASG